jgi:hypothetical protein
MILAILLRRFVNHSNNLCKTMTDSLNMNCYAEALRMKEKLEKKESVKNAEWVIICTGQDKVLHDYIDS